MVLLSLLLTETKLLKGFIKGGAPGKWLGVIKDDLDPAEQRLLQLSVHWYPWLTLNQHLMAALLILHQHLSWHFTSTPLRSQSIVVYPYFSTNAYESVNTQLTFDWLLIKCQASIDRDVDWVLIKMSIKGIDGRYRLTLDRDACSTHDWWLIACLVWSSRERFSFKEAQFK